MDERLRKVNVGRNSRIILSESIPRLLGFPKVFGHGRPRFIFWKVRIVIHAI